MVKFQPICLEVSCSNIVRSAQNATIYTAVLTADGGQETAFYDETTNYSTKTYTCIDIEKGMYFSNRDGCIWLISKIVVPCPFPSNFSQITVELTDIDGYNSLLQASEGDSSGAPLPGIIGYVYTVNSSGLPLLNNIPNTPSDDWHTSVISRHLMYEGQGAFASQGTQIYSGKTVPRKRPTPVHANW